MARTRMSSVRVGWRLAIVLGLLAVQVGTVSVGPAGAGPEQTGQWGSSFNLGVKGIHSILLPNGKVLLFSYPVSAVGSDARLYDPTAGTTTDVSINRQLDVFCSSHSLLPDGRVFGAGGHVHLAAFGLGIRNTTIFDPATNTWSDGPLLSEERWYPTQVTLGDGRVLVFSGDRDTIHPAPSVDAYNPVTNTTTQLPSSATLYLGLYPRQHLLPDGRILTNLTTSQTQPTKLFDPATNTWTNLASTLFGTRAEAGSSILLPGLSKVLYLGGSPLNTGTATATAEIIDMSQPTPQWRYTNSMSTPRMWANALILPDGKVLVVGGGGQSRYKNPVRTAELFDPVTETWTTMAAQRYPRMYHSTAILLPDGRVLSAGHDRGNAQLTGEIFSPPYLFNGPRPTITSAPAGLGYGSQQFQVSTPDAGSISRVALIRPGSVTHSVAFDQRYVDLSFTRGSGVLNLTGPANGNIAPPGYYMLFIVNSSGVPSVASWVHVA